MDIVPASLPDTAGAQSFSEAFFRVCLTSLSSRVYAIPLRYVGGVFPVQSITPVPGMPDVLAGVTNVRGAIIPLLDARVILELSRAGAGALPFGIVLRHGDHEFGVLVDRPPEIRTVHGHEVLPARHSVGFISSALRLEDRLIELWDVPALVDVLNAEDKTAAGRRVANDAN